MGKLFSFKGKRQAVVAGFFQLWFDVIDTSQFFPNFTNLISLAITPVIAEMLGHATPTTQV